MNNHVGQQLGNYRLIRILGQGGFADVYLGEHVYLKTQAAMKVLHTQITGDNMEDFVTEAQTIARLKHPHIIRVLDFGVQDNIPYLVMDYAPKGTLRQLHPRGSRLPLAMIVAYVKQIAPALHYAHSQKLIHRDIKPENMLLGPNNEIVISDFGIATMAQSSRYQLTQDVVGTVAYMAPEQIQGKPRPVSDEYALGIVIYEWLTGSCPFQGSFTEIASQHVFATPASLQEKLPTLSADVEKVIMMALAKDPQQRFANLQALANALEQACDGGTAFLSTSATNLPLPPSAPTLTPVLSQFELSTVVPPPVPDSTPPSASAPFVLAATKSSLQPPSPNVTPPQTLLPSQHRISRRVLLAGFGGMTVAGVGALAWLRLAHLPSRPTPGPTPTTAFGPTATVTPNPTTPTATPTSPTPQPTPTSPSQPTVSPALVTYRGPSEMYTVSWSPNGTSIASGGLGTNVEVWAASSGASLFTYNGNAAKVYSVAWSPTGSRIASGHSDGTVQVRDGSSGALILYLNGHLKQVNSVAWSPDGNYIVSGGGDKTVKIWDASTGSLILTYSGHAHYVNAVAWSPDGSDIASGSGDRTVQVWDAANGNTLLIYRGHSNDVESVAWSPDSAHIASGGLDDTVQIWNSTTGNLSLTYRPSNGVNTVAWSPNGTYIASGGEETVLVWNAANGNTVLTYRGHSDVVQALACSPDSSEVASASSDATVQVWRAII